MRRRLRRLGRGIGYVACLAAACALAAGAIIGAMYMAVVHTLLAVAVLLIAICYSVGADLD